jgi:uncharacterized protein YdeI (YjbR/CyaY-like superfamily)
MTEAEFGPLMDALACDDEAKRLYAWLTPNHRAEFLSWIGSAPTHSDLLKRVSATVDILAGRDVLRVN